LLLVKNLLKFNNDFKESYINNKKASDPKILIYSNNEGPFKLYSEPIKNKYIIK